MNKQMSKQDRQGVRTASDIERKYNLGDISKNQDKSSKQDILIQQINQNLAVFKAQTNAKIEELEGNDKMWFYSGAPTLENHPAVDWNTDELKAKHIGDMYYDVDNGDMYIFKSNNSVYAWESCFGGGIDYDTAYNEGYNNGYTEGIANASNPLEYAIKSQELFYAVAFPIGYELKISIPYSDFFYATFQKSTGIKKITLAGNTSGKVVNFNSTFRESSVEEIDMTDFVIKMSYANYCFNNAKSLVKIKGEIDFTETVNVTGMFLTCPLLEDVRFSASSLSLSINFAHSSKLSSASVQSIIDGLATVETAQTLTLNSAIVLTDEQKATIEAKGWTLVQ